MWPFRKPLAKLADKVSNKKLLDLVHERSPKNLGQFTEIQRGVHTVWWLIAETNNGGISQYFTNSTGGDYPILCQFLEKVGADTTLKALVDFGDRFGPPDDSFPERAARIDYVGDQEESNPDEWHQVERKATNEVSNSFNEMVRSVAGYIRENLDHVEAS